MFGLMLLGIVVVGVLVTIPIARWLGKKLPDKPWRKAAQVALFPLVFAVPVLDEIIAWPQLQMLCAGADGYQYAQGMTQEKAVGRQAYRRRWDELRFLFPAVQVRYFRNEIIDFSTSEVILEAHAVEPVSSLFAAPSASGSRNPWLLRECPPRTSVWEKNRVLIDVTLKLKIVSAPNSNSNR